ncbi:MAG TPA: hypothetical protein VF658_05020 [Pyrinomonadaceae bacterium]|jgi:hypothetical protein
MLKIDLSPRTNSKFSLSNLIGIRSFKRSRRQAAQKSRGRAVKASVEWTQTSWGRKFIKSATLVLALFCSASITLADVKISTKSSGGGQSMTSTTYIKGARQRTEGLGYTTIYQCDLKRMIQINDKTRSYLITPLAGANNSKPAASPAAGTGARRGGVITYTTTSTDTGERKQMLGLTAKHIKSKTVVEASEGACNSMNMEMETDGWYVDLPTGQNCSMEAASSFPLDQSECVDEVRYKTEGAVNTGYPIMTTTRMKFNMGADGPEIPASTSTQEVVDISNATLDRALFEIPAGYKEVKNSQELGSPY